MENVLKKVKLRQVDWMPRVKPNDFKDLGLTPEHRSLHEIHHLLVFIYPLTKPTSNIMIYNVYIYQTVDFIILKVNMFRLTRFDWTARSTRILRLLSYGNLILLWLILLGSFMLAIESYFYLLQYTDTRRKK